MHTPTPKNTQSGAAMLGIVLVIVVILLALVGALAIGPQLQNIANERQTVKRAGVIVDNIKQYYLARGELPSSPTYKMPVDALNLEQKYRYDAWGQEWCYYRASDIVGVEVSQYSGAGQQVAGLLVSSGPDQNFQTLIDGTQMNSCADFSTDRVEKGGDDIVIPLNVQGEAIQIAKNELGVLTSRGCPRFPDELDTQIVPGGRDFTVQWEDEFGAPRFLTRTGLGSAYARDPWSDGSYNYIWRWVDPDVPNPNSGWWVSMGPDGSEEIVGKFIDDCTGVVPPGAFVALDFSQFTAGLSGSALVSAHDHITDAGSTPYTVYSGDSDIGNVLNFSSAGGVNNFIEMVDVANLEDICEYTIMGWFRAGAMDTSRQTIANRRPAGGGHYQTWLFGLNAFNSTGPGASSITPERETYLTASRGGDSAWPYLRMYTSQGEEGRNTPALRTPWRGMGFYPNRNPPVDHYGSDSANRTWHFFAINVRTNEDTEVTGLTGAGDNRYCVIDDTTDGKYRATMYMSDNNSPHKLHAVELTPKGQSSGTINIPHPRGPDVGPEAPRWRNFLGRLATTGGETPFDGQISRYYIYDSRYVLDHNQIVRYFENTCDIFTTNCQKNPVYNFAAMTSQEITDFINDPRMRSWNKDQWDVCDPHHANSNYHCDTSEPYVRILKNTDLAGTDGQAIFVPIPSDYDQYVIRAVARMVDTGTTGTYGIFYDTTLDAGNLEAPGYRFLFDRGYGADGGLQLRRRNSDNQLKAFVQADGVPSRTTEAGWWTDLHLIELRVTNNGGQRDVEIKVYDLAGTGETGAGEIWSNPPRFEGTHSYAYTSVSGQKYTGFRTSGVRSNFLYLEIEQIP